VLTVRGAAPVSTAEYLFAGENGTGHFPGYPLQQGLHVAQRIDNREMILNGLKKNEDGSKASDMSSPSLAKGRFGDTDSLDLPRFDAPPPTAGSEIRNDFCD
jgi:hypothetical protein